jgi:hypothetical protein
MSSTKATQRDAMLFRTNGEKCRHAFQSQGAEITPHGHNETTPRKLAHGGSCSCWRYGGRFAKGGAAVTQAWRDRAFAVQSAKGIKIHAPHSGEGLVMNIHLSPVGAHAISLHSGPDGYSGAVDSSRMVQRSAERRLTQAARPTPFPAPQAPAPMAGPTAIPTHRQRGY